MTVSPPFVLRRYEPTDFAAVLAAAEAAAQADALTRPLTAADLRARLGTGSGYPRLNPADDSWVAAVREAGVVAYADGWLNGEGAQLGYRTECFVHPAYRGRGLGRALLNRQAQRAQAIARRLSTAGAPVTVTLEARVWERQTGAVALLDGTSLSRARTYVEMLRDLTRPLPALAVPAGLRLAAWTDWHADEAVWRADDEAFADHWGALSEPFDRFMRRVAQGQVQREHSFVAWVGSQVAGASLNDMSAAGAAQPAGRPAWIRHLFVRRAWRGRGFGRALLAASLARARELGYARAGLMVDEDNETGAVALYQSSGFEAGARRFTYQRAYTALASDPAPDIRSKLDHSP